MTPHQGKKELNLSHVMIERQPEEIDYTVALASAPSQRVFSSTLRARLTVNSAFIRWFSTPTRLAKPLILRAGFEPTSQPSKGRVLPVRRSEINYYFLNFL